METLADIPIIAFADTHAWKTWLDKNHEDPIGVWIKIAKKNSGVQSVTYAEALEQNPTAKAFFESLTKAEKYSVLWRLMTATTQQIRGKRLASMIASLSAHKKIGS